MSISTLSSLSSTTRDDGTMSTPHPRADGPRRRRFTPEQKLAHLTAYEQACQQQQGGAYLRREGLYSSLMTEWRRLRDAGVLEGKQPGQAVGRPLKEQAEIARLRRELETTQQRLDRTETALEIMEKHAHSWKRPPRAQVPRPSARSADGCLHRPDRAWKCQHAGRVGPDRHRSVHCPSPPDPAALKPPALLDLCTEL